MKKCKNKMLKIISFFIMFLTCINVVNAESNFETAYTPNLYERCNEKNKCIPICVYSALNDGYDDNASNGEAAYIGYYYSNDFGWEFGLTELDTLVYTKSTILPATDIYWSDYIESTENKKQRPWNKATEASEDGESLFKPYDKLKNDFVCPTYLANDHGFEKELCLSNRKGTCKSQENTSMSVVDITTRFQDDRKLVSSFAEDVGNVINDTYNKLYIFSSQYPAGADPDASKKLKFLADIDSTFNEKYNSGNTDREKAMGYCSVLKENLKDEDKYFKSLATKVTDYREIIDRQLQASATEKNVRNKEVYTDETLSSILTITDSSGNKKYRQITDPTGQTYIEKLHSIYAQNVRTSLNYVKDICNSEPGNDIKFDEAKLTNMLTTSYETTVYKNVKLDTDSQFSCGTLGDLADLVKIGYFIIEMVALVILVVFTVLDYAKVILSGEQDEMKKTNKRLATRLIIMVVLLLLPALINFVLGVFNIEGFNSENPLCVEIKNK